MIGPIKKPAEAGLRLKFVISNQLNSKIMITPCAPAAPAAADALAREIIPAAPEPKPSPATGVEAPFMEGAAPSNVLPPAPPRTNPPIEKIWPPTPR